MKITPAPLDRSLSAIAVEIGDDWPKVKDAGRPGPFGPMGVNPAHPYWDAMLHLPTADLRSAYYMDSASSVVRYFLANAGSWRGPVAQRVKTELRAALADFDSQH